MNKFEIWVNSIVEHAAFLKAAADRGYYRDRPIEEFERHLRDESALLVQIAAMMRAAVEMPDEFQRIVAALPEPRPRPNLKVVE